MKPPIKPGPLQTEQERITALAYQIYEKEGRPDGRDQEHWAKAQRAVHEQRLGTIVPPDGGT